jgi:hypothetical protein
MPGMKILQQTAYLLPNYPTTQPLSSNPSLNHQYHFTDPHFCGTHLLMLIPPPVHVSHAQLPACQSRPVRPSTPRTPVGCAAACRLLASPLFLALPSHRHRGTRCVEHRRLFRSPPLPSPPPPPSTGTWPPHDGMCTPAGAPRAVSPFLGWYAGCAVMCASATSLIPSR